MSSYRDFIILNEERKNQKKKELEIHSKNEQYQKLLREMI